MKRAPNLELKRHFFTALYRRGLVSPSFHLIFLDHISFMVARAVVGTPHMDGLRDDNNNDDNNTLLSERKPGERRRKTSWMVATLLGFALRTRGTSGRGPSKKKSVFFPFFKHGVGNPPSKWKGDNRVKIEHKRWFCMGQGCSLKSGLRVRRTQPLIASNVTSLVCFESCVCCGFSRVQP